jgi:hypothetical protein
MNMVTVVLQVLHALFSGKGMMMNTHIHTEEQRDMAAHMQTTVTALEGLCRIWLYL